MPDEDAPQRSRAVLVIPLAMLIGIPVMVTGWLLFYQRQKATLARASSTATSPDELAKLGRRGNLDVKMRVALNPKTPPATVERIAEQPTLRYYLVFKPDAPPVVLRKIVEDHRSKKDALLAAAGHPHAPVDVLDALSGHPDPRVRAEVARNPRVRQEILNRLANDADPGVADAARSSLDARSGGGRPTEDES